MSSTNDFVGYLGNDTDKHLRNSKATAFQTWLKSTKQHTNEQVCEWVHCLVQIECYSIETYKCTI